MTDQQTWGQWAFLTIRQKLPTFIGFTVLLIVAGFSMGFVGVQTWNALHSAISEQMESNRAPYVVELPSGEEVVCIPQQGCDWNR